MRHPKHFSLLFLLSLAADFSLFFLIALAAALPTGCQKELGYELPYAGDRLVIHGFLSPDRVVLVNIGKSYPPTGDHSFTGGITNATVALYEDGVFLENLVHTAKGDYLSAGNYRPRVGKAYHVEVTAGGFPPAETLPETIPAPAGVDSFTFRDTVISPLNEDFPALRLSFSFTDTPGQVNYYRPGVVVYYQDKVLGVNVFDLDRAMGVEDMCVYHDGINFLVRDLCFADQSFTLNLGVETRGSVQRDEATISIDSLRKYGGNPRFDRAELYFSSITRNHYEYLKTSYQPEGIELAFNGPRPQHSNVKGGYGILAAYNRQVVRIW
jgi:hypothetical protein